MSEIRKRLFSHTTAALTQFDCTADARTRAWGAVETAEAADAAERADSGDAPAPR